MAGGSRRAIWVVMAAAVLMGACGGGTVPGEVELRLDDYFFEPMEIEARRGQTLFLTLENRGNLVHELTIADLPLERASASRAGVTVPLVDGGAGDDLTLVLEPGGLTVLELVPAEAGLYVFYCSRPGHRDAGMEGTLTVRRR